MFLTTEKSTTSGEVYKVIFYFKRNSEFLVCLLTKICRKQYVG